MGFDSGTYLRVIKIMSYIEIEGIKWIKMMIL